MKHRESGFAVIVVVIMTLITLSIFVLTLATITVSSRNGSAREVQAVQAGMAAESGLNSFVARLRESAYTGTGSDLDCWVQGVPLVAGSCTPGVAHLPMMTLGAAGGQTVDVKVVGSDPVASKITVQSIGRSSSSSLSAQATMQQRVSLLRPSLINVAAPAALASCPGVTTRGSSSISGAGTESSGIIPNLTTVTTASPPIVSALMASSSSNSAWPAAVTVADGTFLNQGSFIQIGGRSYVVNDKPSVNVLNIQPASASTPPTAGSLLTGAVNLIGNGVRGTPLTTGASSQAMPVYRLPVSDPTGVFVDDVLYIDSGGVTYAVTVTGRGFAGDVTQGYVDVILKPTGPGSVRYNPLTGAPIPGPLFGPPASLFTSLPTGTPIRRYIPGVMSAGPIDGTLSGDASGNFKPGGQAGSSTVKCGDALFSQVFGQTATKANMYERLPPENRYTTYPGTLGGDVYWLGPKTTPSNQSFMLTGGSSALNGSGILIVNGDLTLNGGTFNGVVYVTGNFSNQGNSTINGSVIVEGNVTLNDTKLAGTMSITYDPLVILKHSRSLSPVSFGVASGTWGQQ